MYSAHVAYTNFGSEIEVAILKHVEGKNYLGSVEPNFHTLEFSTPLEEGVVIPFPTFRIKGRDASIVVQSLVVALVQAGFVHADPSEKLKMQEKLTNNHIVALVTLTEQQHTTEQRHLNIIEKLIDAPTKVIVAPQGSDFRSV